MKKRMTNKPGKEGKDMKAVFILKEYASPEIIDLRNNVERIRRILCLSPEKMAASECAGVRKVSLAKNRFKSGK